MDTNWRLKYIVFEFISSICLNAKFSALKYKVLILLCIYDYKYVDYLPFIV